MQQPLFPLPESPVQPETGRQHAFYDPDGNIDVHLIITQCRMQLFRWIQHVAHGSVTRALVQGEAAVFNPATDALIYLIIAFAITINGHCRCIQSPLKGDEIVGCCVFLCNPIFHSPYPFSTAAIFSPKEIRRSIDHLADEMVMSLLPGVEILHMVKCSIPIDATEESICFLSSETKDKMPV